MDTDELAQDHYGWGHWVPTLADRGEEPMSQCPWTVTLRGEVYSCTKEAGHHTKVGFEPNKPFCEIRTHTIEMDFTEMIRIDNEED